MREKQRGFVIPDYNTSILIYHVNICFYIFRLLQNYNKLLHNSHL